jgi:hypothetical protein
MKEGIAIFFCLACLPALAQFTYTYDQSIPVKLSERQLDLAWAGGINSAQVNMMDLNADNTEDLVIFDRSANRVLTFLASGNDYRYAPEYEVLFPAEITHWLLLRDFNCDGKKDLFTSDPFGIVAYINTSKAGGLLSWRPFNPGFPILTKGFSGNVNLKVNQSDIPAIDDVDGDGDLDILNVKFIGLGTVEWHRNMAVENTGKCDSLQLERVTQVYGGFQDCDCGSFAFGGASCPGRTEHTGGKALLTIDLDNDGDREILFSEEDCGRVYQLTNIGTKDAPITTSASVFPNNAPIAQPFPAAFLEDINHDGKKDLLASPNLYARTFTSINYRNSLLYYQNTGTSANPQFTFVQNNFLQGEMIDLIDYTIPAFADADGDEDEDMFIGVYGDEGFQGSVHFFENVGTKSEASFQFVTDDYGFLGFAGIYNVKPQFVDMNGDGKLDLAFTSTDFQNGRTTLQYLPNMADQGIRVSLAQVVSLDFQIGFAENLTIADVNLDGLPDALVGKADGALHYWENAGPLGSFNLSLKSSAYLSLGASTTRQSPATTIADLDADGRGDLILADQRGFISIYGDFRNFDPLRSQPSSELIYNSLKEAYISKNLGPRIHAAVTNLFNSDKPSIVIGNVMGGLIVLKNDEGKELPPEPVIQLYPNPISKGEDLMIRADRNVVVQIYSLLGQKMSEPVFIAANQEYPLSINVAAGIYIAHFTSSGKVYARKFVVR